MLSPSKRKSYTYKSGEASNCLPVRRGNRLPNYDYSQKGTFFVTICTQDRKHIFGEIVGDAALGVPRVELSECGIIIKSYIHSIAKAKAAVIVDKYVIMPNHVHLILKISDVDDGTPKAASPTKAVIPKTINSLKGLTTKRIGMPIWQHSYYDHIIRNEDDYLRIVEYMENNPARWVIKEQMVDNVVVSTPNGLPITCPAVFAAPYVGSCADPDAGGELSASP
jgi:REP element-mobilizing transposase RayT